MANAIKASLLRAKALYTGFVAGAPEVDDSTLEVAAETLRVKDGGITNAKMASASVDTAQLIDAKVTAAKLKGALKTGYIPLSLFTARIIATNAIQNTTEAGVPDGNTAGPHIERVNAATDKQGRLVWAATEVNEIQFEPIAYPPDLDDGSDITVHFLARSASTNDTPVLTVSAWEGVGDTNFGGNTAALSNAVAEKTVTLLAANVGAAPNSLTLSVLPGTHGTDAVWVYAAWVTYVRKDN